MKTVPQVLGKRSNWLTSTLRQPFDTVRAANTVRAARTGGTPVRDGIGGTPVRDGKLRVTAQGNACGTF